MRKISPAFALAAFAFAACGSGAVAAPPVPGKAGENAASATKEIAAGDNAPLARAAAPAKPRLIWINHLSFLAGDPSVQTSYNSVTSGVGGGLSGLIIRSTSLGDTASPGGNKVVETALQTPPGVRLKGVRVCYELSNARSFITQIRLTQVQNPPATGVVKLDDATDQTSPGPVCVDSQPTDIDVAAGPLLLNFRVNFGDLSDRIVIRGVGLYVSAS